MPIVLPLWIRLLDRQLQSLLKLKTQCLGCFLVLSPLTRLLTNPKLARAWCSLMLHPPVIGVVTLAEITAAIVMGLVGTAFRVRWAW